jgi:hypothetical protein
MDADHLVVMTFGPLPITPEQVVKVVREQVFPLLGNQRSAPQGCRRALTDALYGGLRNTIDDHAFALRHKGPDHERNDAARELMWDFVCVRKCDGLMALALESEWSDKRAIVLDDFCKLFYAKAPLKVLIYAEQGPNRTVWKEMQETIKLHPFYFAGERFMILNLRAWESWDTEAVLYEAREQGSGVRLLEKSLNGFGTVVLRYP